MRYACAVALLFAVVAATGCNDKKPNPVPPPVAEPTPAPSHTDTLKPDDTPTRPLYTPATPRPLPAASATPAPTGGKKYVIKKGDTLIKIAREQLGDEHKLKALKDANPGIDYDKLKEGQEINLPSVK